MGLKMRLDQNKPVKFIISYLQCSEPDAATEIV